MNDIDILFDDVKSVLKYNLVGEWAVNREDLLLEVIDNVKALYDANNDMIADWEVEDLGGNVMYAYFEIEDDNGREYSLGVKITLANGGNTWAIKEVW